MPQYPPAAAGSLDPDRDQDHQAGAFYTPPQLIAALAAGSGSAFVQAVPQ